MLSKAQQKFLNSLQVKKYRQEQACFLLEGKKIVEELLVSDLKVRSVFVTKDLEKEMKFPEGVEVLQVEEEELKKVSALSTPPGVLAVAEIPSYTFSLENLKGRISLALDNIQDPGNMGTIIRIADWFGIEQILCSENCVDVYNPKVVQATMGSIARVKCLRLRLAEELKGVDVSVYGTLLEGESIYETAFEKEGVIVIGNESNGISKTVQDIITKKISIPKRGNAESLNAAIATGIVCSEVFRS